MTEPSGETKAVEVPEKQENEANKSEKSPQKEIKLFNFEWKFEPEDKSKYTTSPEKPFSFTLDPQLASSFSTLSVSESPNKNGLIDSKPADPLPPFDAPKKFKICLIGDEKVGKTSFVDRHLGLPFNKTYTPSSQVLIREVTMETNRGPILFTIWDVAGSDDGLGDAYYIGCDGFIIMFDLNQSSSYASVPEWYKDSQRQDSRPVVLIGNKADVLHRQVTNKQVTFHRKKSLHYDEISVKTGYRFKSPLLALARALVKDPHLNLKEEEPKEEQKEKPKEEQKEEPKEE